MEFGIHEDYPPQDTAARWPQVKYTRTFIDAVVYPGSLISKFTYYAKPSWDAGLTPVVSFRPVADDVSSGKWDTWLRELGTWLSGQPEALVVIWHEPEGSMPGSTFQALFNRCRNNLKLGFPGLKVGYAAMAYHWNVKWNNPNLSVAGKTDTPAAWRVQADFYAVDVYSGFEFAVNTILPEISGFTRWASLLVPTGAPIFIAERGFKLKDVSQSPERVAAIAREAAWLRSDDPLAKRISAYCYWSSTGVENDPLMVLDAPGVAALLSAMYRAPVRTYAQGFAECRSQVANFVDGLRSQE